MVKERRDELNYQNHSPVGVFNSIETITKENKYKELLKGSSEIELFILLRFMRMFLYLNR